MAGIVGSAMGQAISNIGSTIGSYMTLDARDEERRREIEERRAYERDRDATYKRTADQQMAAAASKGGGEGGGRVGALTEEEKDYEAAAMGLTRPKYEAVMAAQRTGDMSKLNVTREYTDSAGGKQTVTEAPPGLEAEFAAKQRTLVRLREERSFGKDYKNVVEGRQGMQDIGLVKEAMAKPDLIPTIGASKAAVKGDGMYEGDSNTTRNQFTGKSEATAVGNSVIGENKAQAGKANADAKATAEGTGKVDITGVAANAANLIKLADAADADGDPVTARKYREQAARLSLGAADKKVPQAPAAAPPDLNKIEGLPKGAVLGGLTEGRGWEVKVDGKVVGYVPPSAKAASQAPSGAAKPTTPPAPASKPAAPPASGAKALEDGSAQRGALTPLVEKYKAAEAQLAAAARSNDSAALTRYARENEDARQALISAANRSLGNQAPGFLAGVIR